MIEVILTFPTPEGSREIAIESERTTFGRGGDSDHKFDDTGLSRLHASIYRDGDRVWIVDENSTNGTFVNGAGVSGGGTPLKNGDSIKIGNDTILNVRISQIKQKATVKAATSSPVNPVSVSSGADTTNYIIPIAVIAFAFLIISGAAVFVGISVFGGSSPQITRAADDIDEDSGDETSAEKPSPKPSIETDSPVDSTNNSNDFETASSTTSTTVQSPPLPSGKTYMSMTPEEKTRYVEHKSQKVAQIIGNKSGGAIPPNAVAKIKSFVDAYVTRLNSKKMTKCDFGDNLQATYERASKNAPFIIRDFYSQGVDPQIGLYLAMIESEHCPCLQSPTKALGLFQFLASTAPDFGLDPADRCNQELSSKAAAKYMKQLSGRFGTGPLSMPLAIGSYNSGQGALSKNLETALKENGSQERSFWTLVENAESLSKQFQVENIKYVPKFYAAAIIGENPQDFGLQLQPLSTYTN